MAAITQADIDSAYNKRQAAEAALTAAQAKEATLSSDPKQFLNLQAAKAETRAAQTAYTRADRDLTKVSAQFHKENAPPKQPTPKAPMTPGQQSKDDDAVEAQKEKEFNLKDHGIPETNAEKATRLRLEAPKQAREDSPAQQVTAATGVQNANTSSANSAETARHDQATEELAIANAQKDALYKAGLLFKDTRGQVSQEAQAATTAALKGIEETRTAGSALLTSATTQRGQDVELQKERSNFVQSMLTTALPSVVNLMMKTPKGSPIAANFLKAFLSLANDSYVNAGLNKTPPPIDMNSPAMQNLTKIAGYKLPDQIPSVPSAGQISWTAAVQSAVGGFPVLGWQGKTGIEATTMPDMPAGTNGDGVNVYQQAAQSGEGQALKNAFMMNLKPILDKPEDQRTPEEQHILATADAEYQQKLKDLATRQAAAPRPTPDQQATTDIKQQLRSGLVSGDETYRANLMMTAVTALDARNAGKPLTDAQTAVLANLDPEDLKIVQQYMTPQVRQMITNAVANKQPLSVADSATVRAALTGASTDVKNRQVPTPAPANQPQTTTQTATPAGAKDEIMTDPAQVHAQQAAYEAQKQDEAQIAQTNPDLYAMMMQVKDEQRAAGTQARADGSMINVNTSPLKDQAQERINAGEKAKSQYYSQPAETLRLGNSAPPIPLQGPDTSNTLRAPSTTFGTNTPNIFTGSSFQTPDGTQPPMTGGDQPDQPDPYTIPKLTGLYENYGTQAQAANPPMTNDLDPNAIPQLNPMFEQAPPPVIPGAESYTPPPLFNPKWG